MNKWNKWKWIMLCSLWTLQGIFPLWVIIEADYNPVVSAWSGCLWAIFCGLQFCLLRPVYKRPHLIGDAKPPRLWMTAILGGLIIGILITCAVLSIGDIVWMQAEMNDRTRIYSGFGLVGGVILLCSWVFFSYFVHAFLKKGPINRRLSMLTNRLFLGTTVEAIAAIPVYRLVMKREPCICITFSGFTIVFGVALMTFLLGPVIILLLLRWRSRSASLLRCPACGHDKRQDENRDTCPVCGIGWRAESVSNHV